MSWAVLLLAGFFEVAWVIGLKYTAGYTRLLPTVLVVIAMVISVWLLEIATRTLPLGTAYAVWSGIGAVGTIVVEMIFFNEPVNMPRLICLSIIIIGIVGLKLVTSH
ncbi:MAG: multidrug efflux SMR transporter [Pseudomonadota bacterium]